MENQASFGDWLRRRRKALDLTQETLAGQVGCSTGLIRKLESDERRPSRQMAELLAEALQIPINERPRFIQVARAQLRTERLKVIAEVADPLPEVPLIQTKDTSSRSTAPHPPAAQESPTPRYTLPIPPTPLIGRDNEVRQINQLLANPECRLLTIVGPGGMGKTRLALAVAQARATFGVRNTESPTLAAPPPLNGIAFVSFVGVASPEFILPTTANALGLTFSAQSEPKQQLLAYLREQQLLLVLDNLEHLLAGVDLLTELLAYSPGLKLLITSRERLNLQGEWVFDLQGLPIPPEHQVEPLATYSAGILFVASAQRVQAGFAVTEENQAAIAQICRLVNGMPLGIELAAAWVHMLSCQEIAQEIERSIDFLAVSRRDLPERHRTLRAVFEHSWKLLSLSEQQVMAALAVFRGGFTRESAAAIAGASLPLLSVLVAKSLVQRRETGRYDLHELVRQYAHRQLEAFGEAVDVYNRSLKFFAQQAQQAGLQLGYPQHLSAMRQIEAEVDNLRAALLWSLQSQQLEQGFQLALALVFFWEMVGYWNEGIEWLTKLLAMGQKGAPFRLRAHALQSISYLANSMGDPKRARPPAEESLQLWQTLPDPQRTREDQQRIAELYLLLGAVGEGRAQEENHYEQSLLLSRSIDDQAGIATALLALGVRATQQGALVPAEGYLQESLVLFQASNNQIGVADALSQLGFIARQQGNYRKAQTLHEEGLRLYHGLQFRRGVVVAILDLGHVALDLHEYERAKHLCQEALSLAMDLNHKWDIGRSLVALAYLAQEQNQLFVAAQLLGLSEAVFAESDIDLRRYAQAEGERRIAALRQQLGEETFATAWAHGYTMPLHEALSKLV